MPKTRESWSLNSRNQHKSTSNIAGHHERRHYKITMFEQDYLVNNRTGFTLTQFHHQIHQNPLLREQSFMCPMGGVICRIHHTTAPDRFKGYCHRLTSCTRTTCRNPINITHHINLRGINNRLSFIVSTYRYRL